MTTSPVAMRSPANGRFTTEDTAGPQQTLGAIRAGWPVAIQQVGVGTAEDSVIWDEQSALVIDAALAVSVSGGEPQIQGGSVKVQVTVSGQSAYSGSDGWVSVVPTITWKTGSDPHLYGNLLGKAHLLTKSSSGTRIRIVVTGVDTVDIVALVAPVVENPACTAGPTP